MRYIAYTKGQFIPDEGIGASSLVILDCDREEILYRWAKGRKCSSVKTNKAYEQELGAIIKAVMSVPEGSSIELYSNNETAVKVLKGEWNASSCQNLIEKYVQEMQYKHTGCDFRWLRKADNDDYMGLAIELGNEVMMKVKESGQSEVIETKNETDYGLGY